MLPHWGSGSRASGVAEARFLVTGFDINLNSVSVSWLPIRTGRS